MKTDHIHTIDTVNGSEHIHRTHDDVVDYIAAVGNWGLKTRDCSDPECLEEEAPHEDCCPVPLNAALPCACDFDGYCSRCDAECSGHA